MLGLTPEALIIRLIVLGVGMTLHEFAHNYVAWKMGDPEPARQGRLTLNPFVHINWLGWIMFALIGFGILGSAPISPYRMPRENRRWRWFAAVAAGPVSNLLLAIIFGLIIRILGVESLVSLPNFVAQLLYQMVLWNCLLFVFNLIPLFPIDGWQLVYSMLSPNLAVWWERNRQNSYYVFMGLILLSFASSWGMGLPNILGIIISQPTQALVRLLVGF